MIENFYLMFLIVCEKRVFQKNSFIFSIVVNFSSNTIVHNNKVVLVLLYVEKKTFFLSVLVGRNVCKYSATVLLRERANQKCFWTNILVVRRRLVSSKITNFCRFILKIAIQTSGLGSFQNEVSKERKSEEICGSRYSVWNFS